MKNKDEPQAAGVRRVSTGGSVARAFVRAATEITEQGSFGYAEQALSDAMVGQFMEESNSSIYGLQR